MIHLPPHRTKAPGGVGASRPDAADRHHFSALCNPLVGEFLDDDAGTGACRINV